MKQTPSLEVNCQLMKLGFHSATYPKLWMLDKIETKIIFVQLEHLCARMIKIESDFIASW